MGKDHQLIAAVDSDEDISASFLCCVCLDLLYKPVVLSCGHISCFWCVHNSMSGLRESNCPICRHPYNHFPTICEMLHFLLFKMYPSSYERREKQILEEEMEMGSFSPQFDYKACDADKQHDYPRDVSTLDGCSFRNGEHLPSMEQKESVESVSIIQDTAMRIPGHESCSTIRPACVEENDLPEDKSNRKRLQISVADVQCWTCKQLLFRPVVLNCGHVYCETCINPVDEILTCQVCQSLDPRGFPKVCLEFYHFLEEHFPREYALRREAAQVKQAHVKFEHPITCSTNNSKKGFLPSSAASVENPPWWADPHSKVHVGVGCDFCGVYPIVGDRYKCKDCTEEIGFDLCGDCYNTRSKRPGRFNQQHTPEHKFELMQSNIVRTIMLRLVTGQLNDASASASANHDHFSGFAVYQSSASNSSSDARDSGINSSTAAVIQPESSEDENETQSNS